MLLIALLHGIATAQEVGRADAQTDSASHKTTDTTSKDYLALTIDSLAADSLAADSSAVDSLAPKRQSPLDQQVDYQSVDSMLFDLQEKKIYLYGDAKAVYGDITIEADYLEISMDKSELYATGLPDSTGEIAGKPVFTEGEQSFRTNTMRYNFKTKKGLISEVITQEGEGYLHGETVKKEDNDIMYIKDGIYTTCSLDDPHFAIHSTKLKVIPKDKIVSGPAYLSIADIPTPLAIPFGFFPNSEEQSNGILIPSYGEAYLQGLYLSRGGYYFGLGDYADFAVTGDIYTRGSWAGYLDNRYAKRYKYQGDVSISYVANKISEPEYPDFRDARTYNIQWSHVQDPKAHPYNRFNANVNFGSSQNFRNNIQSSANDYLQANMSSNINFGRQFGSSPFNLQTSLTHRQDISDSLVTLGLPVVSLNMGRIFPFKRKVMVGKQSWYEKIGVSGSLNAENRIEAREDTLFSENTLRNMQNAAQARMDISTNMKAGFISITPSINNRFVGVLQTVRRSWVGDSAIAERTVRVPDGYWEGSANLGVNTVAYGLYQFRSERFKAMRHQITPGVTFSYAPDYSEAFWGYYDGLVDTIGRIQPYSYFANNIYGAPRAAENGVVRFSLNNSLEGKFANLKDTTATEDKKIMLLDALNFNTGYNIAADSMNWSDISGTLRTNVARIFQFQATANWNPYARDATGRRVINRSEFSQSGKIARLTRATATVRFTLRSKPKEEPKTTTEGPEGLRKELEEQPENFVDFSVPWSINFDYNIQYSKPYDTAIVSHQFNVTGDINITPKWKVNFRTGYDFNTNDLSYTSFNVYRDLHCWEFRLTVIPFGPRQSYDFGINVKAAVLQDLKLNRRRSFNTPVR